MWHPISLRFILPFLIIYSKIFTGTNQTTDQAFKEFVKNLSHLNVVFEQVPPPHSLHCKTFRATAFKSQELSLLKLTFLLKRLIVAGLLPTLEYLQSINHDNKNIRLLFLLAGEIANDGFIEARSLKKYKCTTRDLENSIFSIFLMAQDFLHPGE